MRCEKCGAVLALQVLQSPAGYYVGTACCGTPNSRESVYFCARDQAQRALFYLECENEEPPSEAALS